VGGVDEEGGGGVMTCPRCDEKSVVVKHRIRKDGLKYRVLYCANGGCGYVKDTMHLDKLLREAERSDMRLA